jgi:hypothetical protein
MGWIVALPLLMAFVMGTSTLVMALRSADVPVPGAVWKQGPIQFGNATARERASVDGMSATLRRDGLQLELSLQSTAQLTDAQWELLYWRPGDGADDLRVALNRKTGSSSTWVATLPQAPGARHALLLRSLDGQYELVAHESGDGITMVELRP